MDNNTRNALQKIIKSRIEDDGIKSNVFNHESGDIVGFDPYGKYIAIKLGQRNSFKLLKNGVRFIEASSFENFLTIYLTGVVPKASIPPTLF